MRKKFEEELAMLAFGDVDAESARRLELQTQADPDASETFQTYCRMKDELRSLCDDVPADQLSKERLREAILTRGLREHKPAPRFGWLWMPAAAAVLAFSFVALKGRIPMGAASTGPVVLDYSDGKMPAMPGVGVTRPEIGSAVAANPIRTKVVVEKPSTTVAMNTDRGQRNRREGYVLPEDRTSDGSARLMSASVDLMADAGLNRGESHSSALSFDSDISTKKAIEEKPQHAFSNRDQMAMRGAPTPEAPASSPKIVLIQSETDANTGTLRATEVESTANVVVGG